MAWLIAGVALWAVVHLVPAAVPRVKDLLVARLGAGPWRGLFALAVLAGLVAIVVGWRSTLPEPVYSPPGWGRTAAGVLTFVAILLFGASHAPSNLKRWLRHPQLTGLLAWTGGHLLANGDTRSLVLFGGLAVWALIEIPLINLRDGRWQRPPPARARADVINVVASAAIFAVLLLLHPWFAGVKAWPLA